MRKRAVFPILTLLMGLVPGKAEPAPALWVSTPSDFQFVSKGNFTGEKDRRGLMVITHPLTAAKAGDFGFFRTEVNLPPDAHPPYRLWFYATDNNVPSDSFSGLLIDQRKGHRFKQVRIDGVPVWSEDTFLAENPGWKVVDITDRVPESGRFVLEAGLYEQMDSATTLPGDWMAFNPKKAFRPKQEWNQTQSYWGDFAIRGDRPAAGAQPAWKVDLRAIQVRSSQLEPWRAEAIGVENANLIPDGWSWPATAGIPFPKGKFPKDARLGATSGALTFPIRPLSAWPDGSLKWGLVQATLPGGFSGNFHVGELATDVPPPQPVRVLTNTNGLTTLENGLVRAEASPKAADIGLKLLLNGKPVLRSMQFYFEGKEEAFSPQWEAPKVVEKWPERATLEIQGDLKSASGFRYGRCRVRATLFAGLPYLRIFSTVSNENPRETFRAAAYGWKLLVPDDATEKTGEEWFSVASPTGSLAGTVRYFRQLEPNGIVVSPGHVDLQLFRPGDSKTPWYQTHPGEAKTHEIWLAASPDPISPAKAQQFSMLVDRPPGLAIAPLIRGSGVWGPMVRVDPENHAALYRGLIEGAVDPYFANVRTGIRAFGNYPGFASSFYWNSLHAMYALYAMTGERKWLDRAERSVRHLMDLLICHWSPDKKNIGGMYAYYSTKTPTGDRAFEPDFSNADFSIRSQNPHPAFDHWQLTGDEDGKRIAIGIADFLITNSHMDDLARAQSARHQGWVLIALARAYTETGDPRYRDYARAMLAAARTFIDPRRGAYIQTHSSSTHPGIVPFMSGILASGLKDYHEATADPEALDLLATVVTSSHEEMLDREWSKAHPGKISFYYSPNPHHHYQPTPHLNSGLVAGSAYLAALTGDPFFTTLAREAWAGYLEGPPLSPSQTIYDLPETVFWLNSLPDKAEPAIKDTVHAR